MEVSKGRMSRWPEKNEALHKKLHTKPKPLRYKPMPVSEALKQINSYIKVAIDLGTYSFLANEKNVARHIIELEHAIDETAYQLLIHVSLTIGHNVEKAMASLPLYVFVASIDKVTDSFKDLAYLSLMGYSPSNKVYQYYTYLTDVLTLSIEGSYLKGKTIKWVGEEYAIEPIAILRSGLWNLIPEEEVTIEDKDIVYITGVKENINEFLEALGKKPEEGVKPSEDILSIISDIDSMIDIVKLLNDLAHYQLKSQDPLMVDEVMEIEMFVDTLRLRLSEKLMDTPSLDNKDKFALMSLVTRLEDVTDSLTYSFTMPAKDEYREVIAKIIESSGEKVKSITVTENSVAVSKLMEELEEFGASVLAIRKGAEWVAVTPYNLNKLVVNPNDVVLVLYPAVLEDDVIDFMKKYNSNLAK